MDNLNCSQQSGTEALLDVDGLAKALSIHKSWIYSKTRMGLIPCVRIGKYYRFYLTEVLAWLKENKQQVNE